MQYKILVFGTFVVFIITLFILTFSFKASNSININSFLLKDISENWDRGPIFDLEIRKYDFKLNQTFISDEWPGTIPGCDCTNARKGLVSFFVDTNFYQLHPHYCTRNETKLECKDVVSIKPMKYVNWRGSNLLGVRKNLNFMNYSLFAFEEECPKEYKRCGFIDTDKNILCLPINENCPINKIMFLPEEVQIPTDFKYIELKLRNNYKVIYTNQDINNFIIVDVFLRENQMCLNSNEREKEKSYILDKFQSNVCHEFLFSKQVYDTRFQILDSYNKNFILADNNIQTLIDANLPYYDKQINNVQMNLFSRPYLSWKRECSKDLEYNPSIVYSLSSRIEKAKSRQFLVKIFSICLFIVGLFSSISILCSKKGISILVILFQGLFSALSIILAVLCFLVNNILLTKK